ncbi:MAG: hypothetical protein HYX92_15460 [Chloroflexi bacterium]|nr:hypothetical protein [Chloroflexota bacterium]
MNGGYVGRILRVDLTAGEISEQGLPSEEVLREYLGCYGLGLRLLYDMLPPGYMAADPENPLVFITGPLTGLDLPGNNNVTLVTKNFNTGFTVGRSHSHGIFGINMKKAGYDGMVITGKSEKPVYVCVRDKEVAIRDAAGLWGKDTHETEDLIKEEVGPEASVATIGPTGENLCVGALIANDRNHSFSHCGVGSVMGSKKLKAIAITGSKEIPVANAEGIRDLKKRWVKAMLRPGGRVELGSNQKTKRDEYRKLAAGRGFAGKNFTVNRLMEFGLGFNQHKLISKPCHGCPHACPYDCEIQTGPYKGYVATLSGGSENLEAAGALLGITDPALFVYLADQYDLLGIEASAAGCTIAMAIEAFEKGIVTREDTDGLELGWGDVEVAEKLLRKYAHREGFGNILALGPKRAAEAIGRGATDFAVHIKGSAMNLHDWRTTWSVLLSQIVGSGVSWPASGTDHRDEPDAGYPKLTDPLTHKGKAEEVRKTGIWKTASDCDGLCWSASWTVPGAFDLVAEGISLAAGWRYSREDLIELGERVLQLERSFNIRHGLTPEDDFDVSPRLLEAPRDGRAAGISIEPHIRGMIGEYYRLMGWDEKTGRPWRSTLERSGLGDVAKDLWG